MRRAHAFFFCVALLAGGVRAATVKWTGTAGDGLWGTGANWSNSTGPLATDDVVFPGSLVGAISVDLGAATNRTCNSIAFGDASGTAYAHLPAVQYGPSQWKLPWASSLTLIRALNPANVPLPAVKAHIPA